MTSRLISLASFVFFIIFKILYANSRFAGFHGWGLVMIIIVVTFSSVNLLLLRCSVKLCRLIRWCKVDCH